MIQRLGFTAGEFKKIGDTMHLRHNLIALNLILCIGAIAVTAQQPEDLGKVELAAIQQWATSGDAAAQNELGNRYRQGHGILKDSTQALAWYRRAADQNLALAQDNLSSMYRYGDGVPQDGVQAFTWEYRSAESGYAVAQYKVGFAYERGEGTAQNFAQALVFFHKAAEQGNVGAQNALGTMYYRGEEVPQNYPEAAIWFRRAADQNKDSNSYLSQWQLGDMYYNGQGVLQSYAQALAWYRMASVNLITKAEYSLGMMYQNGVGVPQDSGEARKWLQEAAGQGSQEATSELSTLAPAPSASRQIATTQSSQPDDARQDWQDQVDSLTAEVTEAEQEANDAEAYAEGMRNDLRQAQSQGGLAGIINGGISQYGVDHFEDQARKARQHANDVRQQLADLSAAQPAVNSTVSSSTANYSSTANASRGYHPSPHNEQVSDSSNGSSACHNMTRCVQVVSSLFEKGANQTGGFLHIVVRNNCSQPIRITASVYAQNQSCVLSQTNNFDPGAQEDLGQNSDQSRYFVQADDNVTSGRLGNGCALVVANSCHP